MSVVVQAPRSGALGLHEESSTPRREDRQGGCGRWPESLRLRNHATGELVWGRCCSPNQCSYCAALASIENAELIALDAAEHFAPEVWACLGTRTPTLDPRPFYRGREFVLRALRRRWPEVELVNLREFTTGYGPRSGGFRRPHWNLLMKGVPASAVDEVQEVVGRVWCHHVDALPDYQHVGPVYEAGGLGRYLALHFQKAEQAPPQGWCGHRFTPTRGYFPEGVKAARERARRSLGLGREVWKLEADLVATSGKVPAGLDLFEIAEARLLERSAVSWSLAHVLNESSDPSTAISRERESWVRHLRKRSSHGAEPDGTAGAAPCPDAARTQEDGARTAAPSIGAAPPSAPRGAGGPGGTSQLRTKGKKGSGQDE